jgi:hypothetical protein
MYTRAGSPNPSESRLFQRTVRNVSFVMMVILLRHPLPSVPDGQGVEYKAHNDQEIVIGAHLGQAEEIGHIVPCGVRLPPTSVPHPGRNSRIGVVQKQRCIFQELLLAKCMSNCKVILERPYSILIKTVRHR